jgi:hypothetical protein
MENEFPAACCGVDVFSQAFKADVSTMQIGDPLDEVFERAAKAIQSPHNKGKPGQHVVYTSSDLSRLDILPLL